MPPQGPYISEIRLMTPYAQAVDISRHKTLGYTTQQAEGGIQVIRSLCVCVSISLQPTTTL